MMLMMPMSFENSDRVEVLFKGLKSEEGESGKYVGILALTVVLAVVVELLGYMR